MTGTAENQGYSLRIAIIATISSYVVNFRSELIQMLLFKGHSVYVLSIDYSDETRKRVSDLGAVPVDYRFDRTGTNPLDDLANTMRLTGILRKIKPEISLAFFIKPAIFGTIAACLAGVKRRAIVIEGLGYFFTERPEGESAKARLTRGLQVLLYRFALPLSELTFFLNPDDLTELLEKQRIKLRKAEILGGIGVNLADYPYSVPPSSPVSFLFVGRLLAEKGIHEYCRAARMVKERYAEARFVILGSLDERNPGGLSAAELESLISDRVIEYPGHVTNVKDWIARASVFVLPSYREGVPRSTQEAMAVGRPVITTDVPGCRETVQEGKNGFLVPRWSAEALAERMIWFIENPGQIEAMGMASHSMAVERFDAYKVNGKFLEILGL